MQFAIPPGVQYTTDPVTGGTSLSAGGVWLGSAPSKNYIACIPGRQFVTSGVPKDLSDNACDGVLSASLTDANLWANNGYMTTAALAAGALQLPLAKSTFNLATESVLFSMVINKAVPGSSEVVAGNGDTASAQGFYLSCRVTSGAIRPVFNSSAGVVSGLADSAVAFADSTDHVLTFAFDSVTKQAFLWRDGALVNTYATGVTGTTTPSAPFALGGTPGLVGVAAKFSGVHLMKFTGGLPLNINRIVSKLASAPFSFLSDLDIKNA